MPGACGGGQRRGGRVSREGGREVGGEGLKARGSGFVSVDANEMSGGSSLLTLSSPLPLLQVCPSRPLVAIFWRLSNLMLNVLDKHDMVAHPPSHFPSLPPSLPQSLGVPAKAARGNFLEAINVTLNVLEKHYMDRDLTRTGNSILMISPSTGVIEVRLLTLFSSFLLSSVLAISNYLCDRLLITH